MRVAFFCRGKYIDDEIHFDDYRMRTILQYSLKITNYILTRIDYFFVTKNITKCRLHDMFILCKIF